MVTFGEKVNQQNYSKTGISFMYKEITFIKKY